MSNVEFISFQDLLHETNIDDPKKLRKILRTRTDLPQISANRPVARKDADAIVLGLTGHKINWLKYKIAKKNVETGGPLNWSTSKNIISTVTSWFSQIPPESKVVHDSFYIVGLASSGGFLKGDGFSEFVVNFRPGINVVIGDRGSGKSTVVNLLGTISDSISKETQVLIQRLIGLLYPDEKNSQIDIANLNQRAASLLKYYGIDKYALFVFSKGKFGCYYVDKTNSQYSLLILDNRDNWEFVHDSEFLTNPPLLFIEQGEVIRIAEDKDGKFYLNSILDAIYPDLFKKRAQIIPLMQDLLEQRKKYEPKYKSIGGESIRGFLFSRYNELNEISQNLSNRKFDPKSERLIQSYLDRHYDYIRSRSGENWSNTPVIDLLEEEENDDVLYYLYVFKISKFLRSKAKNIRKLIKKEGLDTKSIHSNEILPELNVPFLLNDTNDDTEEGDEDEMRNDKEDIVEEGLVDESDIFLSEFGINADKDSNSIDKKLFINAVEELESKEISPEFYDEVAEVVDFLRRRLKVLGNWLKLYRREHEIYTPEMAALIKKYLGLLRYRISVLEEQENKCKLITNLLNKDNLAVKITTLFYSEEIEKIEREVHSLELLGSRFEQLMNANPMVKLADLFPLQEEYDSVVNEFHDNVQHLNDQIENDNRDYIFYPLKIEYRQGNKFRDFHQLSFGQKSGIILKMVLATTEKTSIIIDQPEDNLDAYSIINIIAPSLNKLCTNSGRQIILVTHNSNLIMELSTQNLIVLESRGETGRVKLQGSPISQDAIRELFDILEGGISTFGQKIKTYEEFVGTIKGQIRDMDIQLIESSFRKRTIDGLRNYLQPIVSDGSLLDFLRHQLKQWNPETYRNQIKEFILKLEKLGTNSQNEQENLIEMLTELTGNLENHIQRFQSAIDEIRLMDTQPKAKDCNLYNLISPLATEEYLTRLRRSRNIEFFIDESIRNIYVSADPNHLQLVLRNLISNSLRATELMAVKHRKEKKIYTEKINIMLGEVSTDKIQFFYKDNGGGIPQNIKKMLYKEPVSTKPGKDHGLGGIIIRKLLEINNGQIEILDETIPEEQMGTLQRITLVKSPLDDGERQ